MIIIYDTIKIEVLNMVKEEKNIKERQKYTILLIVCTVLFCFWGWGWGVYFVRTSSNTPGAI